MIDQPSYHTALHMLETERQPYKGGEVRKLPVDGPGVYAIWCGPYECLYIGKSAIGESVKTRLGNHLSQQEPNPDLKRELHLCRDRAEFSICLTDSTEWATELEDRLIKHYQPKTNHNQLG